MLQIREKARNLLWYSLALDESTDLSSTSQLLVFIRGVNLDFQITEDLASVCSMHGTTTEKTFSWKCKFFCKTINQLRGVTVDGGKNMAGVRKGLVGQIMTQLEDLQIPGALFIHCIIHQPGALFIHCIIHQPGALFIHQPGALFIHCIIHQPGALFIHCIIHQPGALFIHLHHTSAGRSVHTLHHTSAGRSVHTLHHTSAGRSVHTLASYISRALCSYTASYISKPSVGKT